MRPISRPTAANASSAYCRSSRVCVAVTIVRTRALSRATVGKAIPCANTPRSKSLSDSSIACDDGSNRALAEAGVEAETVQPLFEETSVVPQPFDDFRLLLEHVQRG